MKPLYFDNAATIALNNEAIDFLAKICRQYTVNASASSELAKQTLRYIEECRSRLLEFVNAQNLFDFIVTSSATEANNSVLKGLSIDPQTLLIYNKADHASLTKPVLFVAQKTRCQVLEIPLKYGAFNLEQLTAEIQQRKGQFNRIVFFAAHTHNISGICEDMAVVSAALRTFDPHAFIHFDGAQSLAKVDFDLEKSDIDSYTISGHKIGSLLGFGGYFLKKNHTLVPLLHGGKQEKNLRSSTYNHPAIFVFDFVLSQSSAEAVKKTAQLKQILIDKLNNLSPEIYFPFENSTSSKENPTSTSPYILALVTPDVPAEVITRMLSQRNIIVASGSACSDKKKADNSLVLRLGISPQHQKCLLRISFANSTTLEEINQLAESLSEVYRQALLLADR